jgi:phosphoglycolate phosphatase
MPAPFAALNAVLFDLDGTLIETHIDFPAMTAAMQELARAHFVPASVTDGKDILGMVDAAAEAIQERGGDGLALRRTAFAALEAMEIAGCAHPNLLPGTHELLSGLVNRGLKVGIVTRNCRAVSVRLLARFALPHHLLLTRDDVPKTKPNPEHLWAALEYLGEPPEHTAMVGDHWMDIQAGVRAGCAATLGILGRNDADWFAPCPPSALARDLSEAAPWFVG